VAHRALAVVLASGGLLLLPIRPLLALIALGAALAVVLNARGVFGTGMYRAMVAFMSALWLTLVGVVATLLGLVPTDPGGNFLLLPGQILLGIAASLFAGSLVSIWRMRRHRARWPGEIRGGRSR
jgi:hypothetical protein